MNTRFSRDVKLTDPIGGNVGDRLGFNSNFSYHLQQKPTSVTFALDAKVCRSWQPNDELLSRAKMLVGFRGFPQLSETLPTVEDRWSALSRVEQDALLLAAVAIEAYQPLQRLVSEGRVRFNIESISPGFADVTMSWSVADAAWFVDQFV